MAVVKITEQYLKTCSLPKNGQLLMYDTEINGFGVRLNPKSIVFFVEKRLGGSAKKKRISIGPYPSFKVAEARKEAGLRIAELIKGIDRKATTLARENYKLPLIRLLAVYLAQRKLRPSTAKRYEYCFREFLKDWINEPWTSLTSTMVKTRHTQISKTNGLGSGNYTFRALSAVLNYGLGAYRDEDDQPLMKENPVLILSRTKSWNKLKARTNYIQESDLKHWWWGINNLNNKDATDFFRLLILTGLRKNEALGLRWKDINFAARTLTVPYTKNGEAHVLPLTAFLIQLLENRKNSSEDEFVFAGTGKHGHWVEVKRSLNQARKSTGLNFTCHDLRRSFATYADTLDISSNGLKRLLNHRSGGDVTFTHYLPTNVERLRAPMQKISQYVLSHAGVYKTPVINLNGPAEGLAMVS